MDDDTTGGRVSEQHEELNATITTRAEMDRAFARQVVELTTSVMAKNLSHFLTLLETQGKQREEEHGRTVALLEEAVRGQKKLVERLDESERDRAQLNRRVAQLEAYKETSRRQELDGILARISALEARGGAG